MRKEPGFGLEACGPKFRSDALPNIMHRQAMRNQPTVLTPVPERPLNTRHPAPPLTPDPRRVPMASAARHLLSSLFVAGCLAFAGPVLAQEADTPEESPAASAIKTSGLPVPRYVAIRSNEINVRSGPSIQYPIKWVFSRRNMPVEVTAEFDTWRRIRDSEGDDGWVMQGMLTAKRSVMISGQIRTLRREPQATGRAVARAEPGVIAKLLRCRDEWCEVDTGDYRGWLKRSEVWGIYPNERLE